MFEDADDIIIPGFSGAELRAEDFLEKFSDPRPRCSPTPDVTVHQYTHDLQPLLRSSPLDVGRRAVEMATTASGWYTVFPPIFESMFTCSRPTLNTKRSKSDLPG